MNYIDIFILLCIASTTHSCMFSSLSSLSDGYHVLMTLGITNKLIRSVRILYPSHLLFIALPSECTLRKVLTLSRPLSISNQQLKENTSHGNILTVIYRNTCIERTSTNTNTTAHTHVLCRAQPTTQKKHGKHTPTRISLNQRHTRSPTIEPYPTIVHSYT